MSTTTATYRWNARQATVDYDAAAPTIHPLYDEVQDAVLSALPADARRVVDLGGGSGRLAERLLAERPGARVSLVDPSAAFLRLAADRLADEAERVRLVCAGAQEAWRPRVGPCDAIVSTSALHHLEGSEKNAALAACFGALPSGGVFINGDEFRPPSDATYRVLLVEWGEHMRSALAAGLIPASFEPLIDRWERSNLDDFGGPRESGDDCHETVEEQTARLYGAGFADVQIAWKDRLWAVVVARKA